MVRRWRWSTSKRVQRVLSDCMKPAENGKFFFNRNPRNLEMMKIAERPDGYHIDAPGRNYWNKLILDKTTKGLTARVEHFTGRTILQSSTEDWSIAKQLYRSYDTAAYINFGKVFAQRCLEAGIIEVEHFDEVTPDGKLDNFLKELEKNGLKLKESPQYVKKYAHDAIRMDKPWMIQND